MSSERWRTVGLAEREPGLDLDKVLDELLATSGAEAAELFLAEPSGKRLWLAGHSGLATRAFRERLSFELGEGFPGLAAATGRPVQSDDLAHDERFLRNRVKGSGFRYCLSLPVMLKGQVIGSLQLASRRTPETVGGRQLLAASIAGRVGDTLELALLRARARIGDVAGDASLDAKRNLERKLGIALEILLEMTGAEGGIVLLADADAGSLHPWVWRGSFERACSSLARAGGEISACTAAHRAECLVLSRQDRNGGFAKPCSVAPADLTTLICVPLVRGGDSLGALSLGFHTRKAMPGRHMVELGGMTEEMASMVADGKAAVAAEERALVDQQRRVLGEADAVVERSLRPVIMRLERAAHLRAKGPERLATEMSTIGNLLRESADQIIAELRDGATGGGMSDRLAQKPPGAGFLDLRCFGHLAIYRDGQPISVQSFKRKRALTLLEILLTNYGRAVHREVLIELLWPDAPPKRGASQLKVVAHYLRRALRNGLPREDAPEHILWTGEGYAFNASSPHRVDTQDFLSMIHWGNRLEERDDATGALAAYRAAAVLYGGDFLEDERYSDWCAEERAYLRDTYFSVLRRSAALLLKAEDAEGAIACYRQALHREPGDEALQTELMRVLWEAGRVHEALKQYRSLTDLIRHERHAVPPPETQALYRQIVSSVSASAS